MGKLTHTVKGPIASFRSADIAPIESLKLHFLPKQEGSGDPSPTNIRPITGWTGCNFHRAKKNLLDENDPNIYYIGTEKSNGVFTNTVADTRDGVQVSIVGYKDISTAIGVLKSSAIITSPSTVQLTAIVTQSYSEMTYICVKHNGTSRDFKVMFPITIPVGTEICVSVDILSTDVGTIGGFKMTNIQVEVGDSASSYESYSGSVIHVTFPDGQTIYGGYIDPVAGEIVAEYELLEGLWGDWPNLSDQGDGTELRYKKFTNPVYGNGITNHNTDYCNVAKYNYNNANGTTHYYIVANSYNCRVYLPSSYDTTQNVQVIGKLLTPIHIPIPAQDMKAFLDRNNFWSDANDDTEVEYAFADRLSERKLIMDTPHIASASGSVASFNTDLKAPIVDLKAHFTPVQEGSGDPSPENERAIHGFTGLLLHHDGKNIIDLQSAAWSGDSSKVSYSISGGDVTITAKTSGRVGFVGSQYMIKQNVPYAWLGKKVYFGCSDVIHNNPEHICTVVVEFRDETGTIITDPTVITTNDGTKARSFTIPSNTKEFSIMFRIAQNCGTVDVNAGDYVTFKDFYIRYPADTALYEPYDGETIPIEFPAMKNLLDTSKVLKSIGGATFSYSEGSWSFENCGTGNGSAVWGSQVFPAGTYTIKATASREGVRGFRLLCSSASCGGQWLDWYEGYFIDSSNGIDKITFTTTESFKIGLCFLNNSQHPSSPGTLEKIQLERGSVATDYESRATIYGGYIDAVRGKLVATHGFFKRLYGPSNPSGVLGDYERHVYNTNIEFKPAIDLHDNGKGPYNGKTFCNVAFWGWNYFGDHLHYYIDGHQAYIMLPVGTDPNTEIEFCAELATPIEYDITPQILKTLKGTNNIWSDLNGNVEVKYWTH